MRYRAEFVYIHNVPSIKILLNGHYRVKNAGEIQTAILLYILIFPEFYVCQVSSLSARVINN